MSATRRDLDRGIRLANSLAERYPDQSRSEISRRIGIAEKNLRSYEKGVEISTVAIARLIQSGFDVLYIITGENSPDCRNGKLCELLPRFVGQLAGLLEESASADPAVRSRAIAVLRRASSALQEALQEISKTPGDVA